MFSRCCTTRIKDEDIIEPLLLPEGVYLVVDNIYVSKLISTGEAKRVKDILKLSKFVCISSPSWIPPAVLTEYYSKLDILEAVQSVLNCVTWDRKVMILSTDVSSASLVALTAASMITKVSVKDLKHTIDYEIDPHVIAEATQFADMYDYSLTTNTITQSRRSFVHQSTC